MVEQLDDMPEGTLGFRISGRITRELSPGELRLLEPDELEEAKAWTGGA